MAVVEIVYVCEGCGAVQTLIQTEDEPILPVIKCGAKNGVCLGSAWKKKVEEADGRG